MANALVFGPWSGAVTSTSAVVKVAVTNDAGQPRLELATKQDFSGATIHNSNLSLSEMTVASFDLTGLAASTEHFYRIVAGGQTIGSHGRFRTFPKEMTPTSFQFVCSADAGGGSDHEVFGAIQKESPLFFCHMGDLHYENVNDDNTAKYRKAYRKTLTSPAQGPLYASCPIVYTWDDHDFSKNNAHSQSAGRRAARVAYQECVPHYPLIQGQGDIPIYQAFTVGRVRFLVCDSRSERTPSGEDDNASKTLLGLKQKQWLKDELRAAKTSFPLVVWVNSSPWLGKQEEDSDRWFGYTTERTEIGSFIETEGIRNLCMISGDAHMIAIDDGSSNKDPFGRGGFPIFHAAPLDRTRSQKGGPFSHGTFLDDGGQYGLFSVVDTGGPTIKVIWEGKNIDKGTVVTHTFDSPRP